MWRYTGHYNMVSNRRQYQYIYYVIFLKVHCLSLMRAALCKLFKEALLQESFSLMAESNRKLTASVCWSKPAALKNERFENEREVPAQKVPELFLS